MAAFSFSNPAIDGFLRFQERQNQFEKQLGIHYRCFFPINLTAGGLPGSTKEIAENHPDLMKLLANKTETLN